MATKLPKRESNEIPTVLAYIPHGVNSEIFKRSETNDELLKKEEVRRKIFGEREVSFVVLYNNRNIRRKMTSDVILAFFEFWKKIPTEFQKSTFLLMHTHPIDENGTDLPAVINDLTPEIKDQVLFSVERVEPTTLNAIYNLSDVVINLASNEGFGISTLEALMAERMIVANVTGGLQDQMGFVDESGKLLDEEIHFNEDWGTNHDGRYKKCGDWVIPVFPNNLSLIGSVPTPYITDSRCDYRDAASALLQIFSLSPEERIRRGKAGREYALTNGFNTQEMGKRFVKGLDYVFENWKPRARFGLYQ